MCVLWGNHLTAQMAKNYGQRREDFHVLVAGELPPVPPCPLHADVPPTIVGSNIYNKNSSVYNLTDLSFVGPDPHPGLLKAPLEPVGGYETFIGYDRFEYSKGHAYNPVVCAEACNRRTADAMASVNTTLRGNKKLSHPVPRDVEVADDKHDGPAPPFVNGAYAVCNQFQAFEVHSSGVPVLMACASYASVWDVTAYGTFTAEDRQMARKDITVHNVGTYRRGDYKFKPICAKDQGCEGGKRYDGGDCSGWGKEFCKFDKVATKAGDVASKAVSVVTAVRGIAVAVPSKSVSISVVKNSSSAAPAPVPTTFQTVTKCGSRQTFTKY
jgi:hypothetical protein